MRELTCLMPVINLFNQVWKKVQYDYDIFSEILHSERFRINHITKRVPFLFFTLNKIKKITFAA
jgi:hypothetical protein